MRNIKMGHSRSSIVGRFYVINQSGKRRALSMKDTSGMPDDVKAEHSEFMRHVRESIFGKTG